MSYADSLLADGEHIVYRTKQHWLAPIASARYALMLFVATIVLLFVWTAAPGDWLGGNVKAVPGWLALAAFLIGLALAVREYLQWSAEDYVVTDRRVLKIEGIVNKHSADSSLDKINDAVIEQHLLGRILGYGDLEILTAAEESVDRYSMLNHALVFKRNMLNAKHDLEQGPRYTAPPLRAAAPVAAATSAAGVTGAATPRHSADEVTTTLARLADLRDRGAITPEEYEQKKAELLAQL